jgi:hypothetical protein
MKGAWRGSLFQEFYIHPPYRLRHVISALTDNYIFLIFSDGEREILSGFGLFNETEQPKQQISLDCTVFSNAKKSYHWAPFSKFRAGSLKTNKLHATIMLKVLSSAGGLWVRFFSGINFKSH